jgi:hypothetical protein
MISASHAVMSQSIPDEIKVKIELGTFKAVVQIQQQTDNTKRIVLNLERKNPHPVPMTTLDIHLFHSFCVSVLKYKYTCNREIVR